MSYAITITKKSVKHLRLRIMPDGEVKVTAPRRMPERQVKRFVDQKEEWIEQKRAQIGKKKARAHVEDNQLFLHGQIYTIIHDSSSPAKPQINRKTRTVSSKNDLTDPERQKKRYRSYAKEVLTQELAQIADEHQLTYQKVCIGSQSTKRGSCSSSGTISLNRRLVQMPPEVMTYVLCHELAHLRHMNHSNAFRAYTEQLCPDYRDHKQRLKEHGIGLM